MDLTLQETLDSAKAIVNITSLPVSVDLEDCFAETYEDIMLNVQKAAGIGAVGCSIEDSSNNPDNPIQDFTTSIERVEAAVDAARTIEFPFTLTARAENYFHGIFDLKDTIARLKAYKKAGADVLYAPALPDAQSIKAVCLAVDHPINALLGAGNNLSTTELFALGVTRVSLGSALSRAALTGFMSALLELKQRGSCNFISSSISYFELQKILIVSK